MTDNLRQRIADGIRAATCEGDCDATEDECARKRIQPVVWHFGALAEVSGTPEMFSDAALAAIRGAYVPPPPGSDRDALPEDLRRLIEPQMPPYLSTGCQTARACTLASEVFPDRAPELHAWATREHASCRITRKQDMAHCQCGCHQETP